MNVAEEVINPNLITGYLLYGMTFVVMGVAILMKIRSQSEFLLGRNLWLLGAYGLVHGLADWGEGGTLVSFAPHPGGLIFCTRP